MKSIFIFTIYVLFSLAGLTLIKMGGNSSGYTIKMLQFNVSIKTIAGLFFYGMSFLWYVFFISKMQISLVMPILTAINTCAVIAIGILVFGEKLNFGQLLGLGIIIVGVFLLGVFSK